MDRNDALEEAARIADAFEEENFAMAGDTILLDPVIAGGERSASAVRKSESLMIDGCVHSSMAHAARNIAAAIRALKDTT